MRRILLVEANNMTRWVGEGMPYEVHIPPIGLMYLAAYARSGVPDVEIRIVESSLDCPTDDAFLHLVETFKPDVVGIRSINFFRDEMQRLAALVRAKTDALIIAGGPIVQAGRAQLLTDIPELDLAVKGEGETAFKAILSGTSRSEIPGVIWRGRNGIMENGEAIEIEDVDSIPFPAYDLIDLDMYERQLSYAYNHRRQAVLLTSRGCAYRCTFCFTQWMKLRLRSAANVFAEIKQLVERHDVHDFFIVDDIFNVSEKRALALFDLIIEHGLKIRLYFSNGLRADIVSETFVDRAVEAGVVWFTYALESANEGIQELIRKRVHLGKALSIIKYTQRKGVAVNVSTMFGFPTETREQAQQTLDWLDQLHKPPLLPYHFCLRFFPDCEIADQAIEAGWDESRVRGSQAYSYNDLPLGTPTLSKSDMNRILLDYHRRFGLNNPGGVAQAVQTLQAIGYSDDEILHMYSVLKRKVIRGMGELSGGRP